MTKTTATSEKASQKDNTSHQSASNVGRNGVAQAPPAYGLDFVDNAPIQRVATMPAPSTSPQPNKQNRTGLPTPLKTGVESLSGFSMDDVSVHYNSPKPAQLKALAYTQGTDIYVGPRQEKHLPHEAWHVVQQKQGRVQAKRQAKGMWLNDDTTLEQEADRMGAKALQQKSNSSDSLQTGTSSHVVQRKVGFELEMQVLIDEDGADPGYGHKFENSYFAVHVDHSSRLRPMTEAATEADIVDRPYTSIIELVTKPIDETLFSAGWKLYWLMRSLKNFVTKLNRETRNLTERKPLSNIMSGAPDNLYVSLDTNGTDIDNLQKTDAYIQATVGLDIAQAPALMEMFEPANDPHPRLAEKNGFILRLMHSSAAGARTVTNDFKQQFNIADSDENESLTNLQGLISTTLLYLKTTGLWAHVSEQSEQDEELEELAESMDNSTIKGATPFLFHTDLATVRVFSLTADEQNEIQPGARWKWLTKRILREARQNLPYRFQHKQPMLKWGTEPRYGPTALKFIKNVLTGDRDGVTDEILPQAKLKFTEDVGQADPRREGPVVEFRTLANKLANLSSDLGPIFFPFNAWKVILPGIFKAIRALNLQGAGKPQKLWSKIKRTLGDFMISVLN